MSHCEREGGPVAVGGGMFRAALWKRYAGDPKVLARQAIEVALTYAEANSGDSRERSRLLVADDASASR